MSKFTVTVLACLLCWLPCGCAFANGGGDEPVKPKQAVEQPTAPTLEQMQKDYAALTQQIDQAQQRRIELGGAIKYRMLMDKQDKEKQDKK